MLKPITDNRKLKDSLSKITLVIVILILTAVVYLTGGTKNNLDHFMYLPIILTGLFCGPYWGSFVALLAGLLIGPFMPYDVLINQDQSTFEWTLRLLIFFIVGLQTGLLKIYKDNLLKYQQDLLMLDARTKIPTANILNHVDFKKFSEDIEKTVITIVIEKFELIIYYFTEELYNRLLVSIYETLEEHIKDNKVIFSNGTNLFHLIVDNDDEPYLRRTIVYALRGLRDYLEDPIYFEFLIGYEKIVNLEERNKDNSLFTKSTEMAFSVLGSKYYLKDTGKKEKFDYPLLADINKALNNDEFFLVYQPLKHHSKKKPLNFEALIRWNHPTKGLIPPNQFIPIVENALLINPLSLWVLKNAIEFVQEYEEQGVDILLSINISPRNLNSTTFVDRVQSVIDEKNFDTSKIMFEITEGMAIDISERTLDNLNRLNEMGINLIIDDFGSGHSSISYLVQLPIKYVKLDSLFLDLIKGNEKEVALFTQTINLLKSLDIKIVAEGIETKEVFDLLKGHKLDYYQGYYLSMPLTGEYLKDWILNTPKSFLRL